MNVRLYCAVQAFVCLFLLPDMRDPVAYQEVCDRLLDGKLINHNVRRIPFALCLSA